MEATGRLGERGAEWVNNCSAELMALGLEMNGLVGEVRCDVIPPDLRLGSARLEALAVCWPANGMHQIRIWRFANALFFP